MTPPLLFGDLNPWRIRPKKGGSALRWVYLIISSKSRIKSLCMKMRNQERTSCDSRRRSPRRVGVRRAPPSRGVGDCDESPYPGPTPKEGEGDPTEWQCLSLIDPWRSG
ncbi:hypothetical protein D187_010312 [Cystobacter fuscus DSM 2262]|uniref:Uncharacterized protein n=1 Tax=Cystobacter fuscus (strain ATCC 25194 / DSM 2262 / NBRC 100088 / M29) TaxID=1242864 RepID=S9QYE9_CYSF2|nr:hypothetical protein D187_010312 [Cystobacter fuscus DSM 2262]